MKSFLKILGVLVLLGVIAIVAAGFFLGPIVKKAVNTFGPKLTGTRVELDAAKISALTGEGMLAGLHVGNPEGWTRDKAFYLGSVRASLRPATLLSGVIEVNEVVIDGPEFVYERRLLGGSNLDALLAQIEKRLGGGEPAAPAEPDAAGKKFIIRSFRLENASIELLAAGQSIALRLPPLTLTDLGVAEGGITSEQLAAAVLKRVIAQIGVAAADVAGSVGGAALQGGAQGAKEAAKGALDKLLGK